MSHTRLFAGAIGSQGPDRWARLLSFAAMLLALIGLCGWIFRLTLLTSVLPRYATMKPNTALCLLCLSAALWLGMVLPVLWRWMLVDGLSTVSLLISGLSLAEYVHGRDLGIDRLLLSVPSDGFGDPTGRMSIGTAIALLITSIAVLVRDRLPRVSTVILLCGGLISIAGLITFILGAGPLVGVHWLKSLAIHTAIALFLVQAAALAARPEREPFNSLTRFRNSYLHRGHLLLAVTVLPVVIAIPVMAGVRRSWYDAAFAMSLLLVSLVGVQTYLLWSANVAIEKAAAAIMQSEKLAAVGRLASSIAHEINNPLESITNLLYLANRGESPEEMKEYITHAERELVRISAITSQTLRFHKQATKPRPVDPTDLIDSVLSVYQGKLLNSKVTVEQRLRGKRTLSCFDGEIRQVLSNLVGNAIDAMRPGGGRLILHTREGSDATGRPVLVFTVADTGPGIPPAAIAKIFEPFFTTKGRQGTGLGLWISKEIVQRHEGLLRVRSSQRSSSTGTVFQMFLPCDGPDRTSEDSTRQPVQ